MEKKNDNLELDESQKKIILEEIYRIQIRSKLEKKNLTFRERFWMLLNSPFILLIISSVVISFLSLIYQSTKNYYIEENKKELLDQKASAELQYRFRLLRKVLDTTKTNTANYKVVKAIFDGSAPFKPAIEQFENQSVLSIIFQTELDLNKGNGPLNKIIIDKTTDLSIDLIKINVDSLSKEDYNNLSLKIVKQARFISLLSMKW